MKVTVNVPDNVHKQLEEMGISHQHLHDLMCEMAINPITGEWLYDMRLHELNMEILKLKQKKMEAYAVYTMVEDECDFQINYLTRKKKKLAHRKQTEEEQIRKGQLLSYLNFTIIKCNYDLREVEKIAKNELKEIRNSNPDFDIVKHAYRLKSIQTSYRLIDSE
jgi:hypothetical protein